MNNVIRSLSILLWFSVTALPLKSQQANVWYFGLNAGLDFNSSAPVPLMDGALSTNEGCASICDNNGRILFYTDGVTVYNKNHQAMPNGSGLFGHYSSANSAIIVPQPGSDSIYYIFTCDAAESGNIKGYNYSKVDMTLDNGLGDVFEKNHLLYAPGTEQLCALRHSNGVDAWIVTKVRGYNDWRVYKLDCNGIQSTPITSGLSTISYSTITVGKIKASPDGKKLAFARTGMHSWELFDIDNSTGLISDEKIFYQNTPLCVEFSPDSKLIYVASDAVIQYDISTNNPSNIANSAVTLHTYPNQRETIGAMQLGPNNKIYCAVGGTTKLAVINSPNTPGFGCSLNLNQIDLVGRSVTAGLPNIYPALLANKTADFTFNIHPDCAKVDFTASSAISGNLTFNWDFGDGQKGTGQQVSHTYASSAFNLNKVKLTIVSVYPCYQSITKDVNLKRNVPSAQFISDVKCGDLQIKLTDKSAVTGTTISSWDWDFGDGQHSSLQNPMHTYSGYGNYKISLSVTSAGACNGTSITDKTIAIDAKPIAAFTNTVACLGKPVQLKDLSTIAAGSITNWDWTLHDGVVTGQSQSKTYHSIGNFPVKLTVTSASGCISDPVTHMISVYENPKSSFTVFDTCFSKTTGFQGNASINNGTVSNYWWKIDQTVSNGLQNPTYQFPAPGKYQVQLVTTSNVGCTSDTATQIVTIRPNPVADFKVAPGCVGEKLTIKSQYSISEGSVVSGIWDFGNGDNKNVLLPEYAYKTPGNLTITYQAVSDAGCLSLPQQEQVSIESIPHVDFNFANTCVGKPVDFVNLASNTHGPITNQNWSFGNGALSSVASPSYTYLHFGKYPVTLNCSTQNGCAASKTKEITIAEVNIDAGKDIIAAIGQPIKLMVNGGKNYSWHPSQYLDDPTSSNPLCTPGNNITYYITGVTDQGCIGYDTLQIKTYKGPAIYVANAFAPAGKNRILKPVLVGIDQYEEFVIYNRWGQLVFSARHNSMGWDGKSKGVDQPAGTYVWMIKAKDNHNAVYEQKGTVTIIR